MYTQHRIRTELPKKFNLTSQCETELIRCLSTRFYLARELLRSFKLLELSPAIDRAAVKRPRPLLRRSETNVVD